MSELVTAHETVRFTFTKLSAAAEALVTVLEDARETSKVYRFTSLTPWRVLRSGLTLEGDVADISGRIERIEGATRLTA